MKKDVNKLIAESLLYERAYSKMCRIINTVMRDKNKDAEAAKETGEPADEMYQVVAVALTKVHDEFREKSDDLWRQVDENAEKYERGYDDLFNAIVLRAAQDYEAQLCGYETRKDIEIMEMMPPEHMLSEKLMKRIRKGHKEFEKVVGERGKDILEETIRARKSNYDLANNRIRCPLCGGGLYAYGKTIGGIQQIKCTGCSLFGYARIDDAG